MTKEQPDLMTSKLRLRLPRFSDVKRLVELVGSEYIAVMARLPYPYRRKDAVKWVTEARKRLLSVGIVYYVIEKKETKEVIGTVSAVVQYGSWTAEMGYWLGESYWGNGYATEAAQRIVDYLFETLHLKRVYSNAAVENQASLRVLSKIGMKQERVLVDEEDMFGRIMDIAVYAIERD